jgi:hypothetical protein
MVIILPRRTRHAAAQHAGIHRASGDGAWRRSATAVRHLAGPLLRDGRSKNYMLTKEAYKRLSPPGGLRNGCMSRRGFLCERQNARRVTDDG